MNKLEAAQRLDQKSGAITALGDKIWANPELSYKEFKATEWYLEALSAEGFAVQRDLCGIPTAFLGEYGSGKPVIAFLGEYDALPNLSQVGCQATEQKRPETDNGHGCGHNLMGIGSYAAAVLTKDYLAANNCPGTVRFYGCPAEEGGFGKSFMVRDGLFDDVDVSITWHPDSVNYVVPTKLLALIITHFRFKGMASHAAMSPHLGRSALDAVELMNVGVNYLREHVTSDARMHYAIVDSGGPYANVVQASAQVDHIIRAPKMSQCKEILERVKQVARGAAMMTGTEVEIEIGLGAAETLNNVTLDRILYENFELLGPPPVNGEDIRFAEAIRANLSPQQLRYDFERAAVYYGGEYADAVEEQLADKPVCDYIFPYVPPERIFYGSTDVGDVSQVTPCAQVGTACFALSTPNHTWMITSQATAPMAKKATIHAGKIMGFAAIDLLESPEKLAAVQEEFRRRTKGVKYESIIPKDKKPF